MAETYERANELALQELNERLRAKGRPALDIDIGTGEGIAAAMEAYNKEKLMPQRQGIDEGMLKAMENLLSGSTPLTRENEMLGFGQKPENPLQHILLRAIEAKRLREGSPGGEVMPVGVGAGADQLPGAPSSNMDHRIATLKLLLEALNPFGKDAPGPGTVGNPGVDPEQL
jgi:hypothetical protein